MKETVFRFELQVDSAASDESLQKLKDKLTALKGVLSVETEFAVYHTELLVRACFDSPDAAKKLHRKMMNKIIDHKGVTISSVSTSLTDIF